MRDSMLSTLQLLEKMHRADLVVINRLMQYETDNDKDFVRFLETAKYGPVLAELHVALAGEDS